MTVLATVLGGLVFVLAAAGVIYTAMATAFTLRFFKAKPSMRATSAPPASVTILKPLHGAEPGLRRNLESFCLTSSQLTSSQTAVDIVFGLQDADDPALAIAQELSAAHAKPRITICLSAAVHGQNRKISNLINMSAAMGEVVILSDSDIGAPADYLDPVLAALSTPGVGVVTCPYYGQGEGGFWSRIAAMGLSFQFLPNVITGVSLGLAKPCMGSTIALRRDTLDRIGGLQAFRDVLADDYAIGAAVRALGLECVLAPVLVSHSCSERGVGAVFAHELRWAKTVKGVDPAGHAGSLITHPLPLSCLAALLLHFSGPSLGLLAVSFFFRVWLMGATNRVIGRALGPWWLIPMRDMLSFCVFVGSFFVRSVEWRGRKFQVSADGDLKPV